MGTIKTWVVWQLKRCISGKLFKCGNIKQVSFINKQDKRPFERCFLNFDLAIYSPMACLPFAVSRAKKHLLRGRFRDGFSRFADCMSLSRPKGV